MTDGRRSSARQRGYDARWDRAAAAFKIEHPLCIGCQAIGQVKAAELVDHVEPHKGDMIKFWNVAMWQSACRWHHDVIKPQLERMYEQGEIGLTELRLDSATAIKLSRQREAKPIGFDGWPA
jgi:5-methylcytosine-specific restriction protein A